MAKKNRIKVSKTMSPTYSSRRRANKAIKTHAKLYKTQYSAKGRKGKKYRW